MTFISCPFDYIIMQMYIAHVFNVYCISTLQLSPPLEVLLQHYALHKRVAPPQCQSQAWIKEGYANDLCCHTASLSWNYQPNSPDDKFSDSLTFFNSKRCIGGGVHV